MTRTVIFTADDFGLCREVNEAVEQAHRGGTLSCASLIISAPDAPDAIERARRLPGLGVGLHIVLVEGQAVLPPATIPALVNENGAFGDNPTRSGFRYFFDPRARRQLALEIRAQFEAFRRTGLTLDHVNAHNHLHLHPTILGLILEIGRDFGLKAMRLPIEPATLSARAAEQGAWPRAVSAFAYSPMTNHARRQMRQAGLRYNDWVFGLSDSGHMTAELVARQIDCLPEGITEFYFHPATRSSATLRKTMPDYEHAGELAALVSPEIRARLDARGIKPIRFGDLA